MTTEIFRDLGKHEAEIEALRRELTLLRGDLHDMKECLESIKSSMDEAKGGWRTLMFISGISATVGAALFKILSVVWAMFPMR